jgi:putative acetyltransferase
MPIAPTLTVTVEAARQDEVVDLLRLSDEFAFALYPADNCYLLDVSELEGEAVTVFVARHNGAAVGMAALVARGDGSAEIKRLYVLESARGLGVASAILRALEETARTAAITLVQLETGTLQPAAIALYERHGYRHIPNFGQYIGDPTSVCMEKLLG